MTSQLKVLKQILDDDKKAPVQLIAKQLGMGNDYIRYLCKELLKKDLVKKLEKRDWYEITQKGQERFKEVEEIIKESVPEKHIPPQKKATEEEKLKKKTLPEDSTHSRDSGQAGSPRADPGQAEKAEEKVRDKIIKRVKRKVKKKTKKEAQKRQKERAKKPIKLRSRKKKVIKNEKERKAVPLEKQLERQSKKIVKVFKNLFHIKKS